MELTEDEIIQKYGKKCGHCNPTTLLLYEYGFTSVSCGYNVIKQKHELSRIQREKTNFINRLKYAELKILFICVDVYRFYEGDDCDKMYEVVSTLKKIKN